MTLGDAPYFDYVQNYTVMHIVSRSIFYTRAHNMYCKSEEGQILTIYLDIDKLW